MIYSIPYTILFIIAMLFVISFFIRGTKLDNERFFKCIATGIVLITFYFFYFIYLILNSIKAIYENAGLTNTLIYLLRSPATTIVIGVDLYILICLCIVSLVSVFKNKYKENSFRKLVEICEFIIKSIGLIFSGLLSIVTVSVFIIYISKYIKLKYSIVEIIIYYILIYIITNLLKSINIKLANVVSESIRNIVLSELNIKNYKFNNKKNIFYFNKMLIIGLMSIYQCIYANENSNTLILIGGIIVIDSFIDKFIKSLKQCLND